jgi:DNA-binding transcriptional ArsR family regulator
MSFTSSRDPERPAHQPGEPERTQPQRDQPERDQPERDQPERDQAERAEAERGEHAGPEPGSLENPLEISDPRALRALAHPARLAILQHLALDGPATATECAEVAGLSPSACSYHLRALARYGFVDEDPSGGVDRRHRPWRARVVAITGASDPIKPAAFRAASRLLTESMQARVDEVRTNYLDRETEYPPDWQRAAGWGQDVLHVTPAELDEVKTKIYAILAEYRRLSREDQSPDSRRVHVMLDFTPWFTPDADA